MRYFVIFILLFAELFAQEKHPDLMNGINYLYNIKIDSAEKCFKKFINENNNKPHGYFFMTLLEWWKINLNKYDAALDDTFLIRVRKTVNVCDKILEKDENNTEALFFKGGALGYRGLVYSLRDSWLKAAEDGKQALNLLEKTLELDPNNKDALLGIGIYNYFAEIVPELYPLIKPLMIIFPKGDKNKGLNQIKEVALKSNYAEYEANYILAYIYMNYEKNFLESEKYSLFLVKKFPDNPVFEKYYCNSLIGLNRFSEALDIWKKIIEKSEKDYPGYSNNYYIREAYYYIALCELKLNNITESLVYLEKTNKLNSVLDSQETSYGIFTYLMFGMVYDKLKQREIALNYYKKVLSLKNYKNSHESAKTFIEKPYN